METITADQYKRLKSRLAEFEAWRNGRSSYKTEDVPASIPQVSNEERSQIEVYEFVHNPPARYSLYIKLDGRKFTATTWTGDVLGSGEIGREYEVPAFGGWPSKRVSLPSFKAINGKHYSGTFYKSSGDYARVKMCKA